MKTDLQRLVMHDAVRVHPDKIRAGISWGLDWPFLYADCPDLGGWIVYHRETGIVWLLYPYAKNVHGYDFASDRAMRASMPKHDIRVNAAHDMVS